MKISERRAAHKEARAKFVELLHNGKTPQQARTELNKWGKEKYGALDWPAILALLKPLIQMLISKWLGV